MGPYGRHFIVIFHGRNVNGRCSLQSFLTAPLSTLNRLGFRGIRGGAAASRFVYGFCFWRDKFGNVDFRLFSCCGLGMTPVLPLSLPPLLAGFDPTIPSSRNLRVREYPSFEGTLKSNSWSCTGQPQINLGYPQCCCPPCGCGQSPLDPMGSSSLSASPSVLLLPADLCSRTFFTVR